MTDYEKGTPAWDIGIILTRHGPTTSTGPCARVVELQSTAQLGSRITNAERLERALNVQCDCGRGDSDSERTSITNKIQRNTEEQGEPATAV